ncbi:hypothetical protein, partial [Nocardiopsis sp. FR6]|uniref:hypothetical protein n=1 Tax=Nocardiopsis sp. FR6 TaxID=2605986 RepID=UPI0013597726
MEGHAVVGGRTVTVRRESTPRPPGAALPGADPSIDPYPSQDNRGDLDMARQKLEECGQPDGFSTSI